MVGFIYDSTSSPPLLKSWLMPLSGGSGQWPGAQGSDYSSNLLAAPKQGITMNLQGSLVFRDDVSSRPAYRISNNMTKDEFDSVFTNSAEEYLREIFTINTSIIQQNMM